MAKSARASGKVCGVTVTYGTRIEFLARMVAACEATDLQELVVIGNGIGAPYEKEILTLAEKSPLQLGQQVSQGYGLQLPDDIGPGSYPLIAGLYLPQSGQRLPRADGSPDDFLYLMNIEIGGR